MEPSFSRSVHPSAPVADDVDPERGAAQRTISDLPQAQVDAIIRTKRKAREPKACYPCHTRKVKCDRQLPCDGCIKRDHADLCSYERPSKKRHVTPTATSASPAQDRGQGTTKTEPRGFTGSALRDIPQFTNEGAAETTPLRERTTSTSRVTISREEWENVCNKLKEMESTISSLRMGLEQVDEGRPSGATTGRVRSMEPPQQSESASEEREGIHAANTFGEGTVHLGSRSVLAYILNKSDSAQAQALLEGGILPKLGLDNETATYPFVDLWSSDTSMFDVTAVCGALPNDQQIRELFCYYRDIAGTLYPVLVDVPGFENQVETFIRNRAAAGGVLKSTDDQTISQRPFGMSISFLGLLFAVLASGCQSSDFAANQRELTSQVYVCCSYQCLRMTNFVVQPTIIAMKTLLIIGNVLSYNMNPGVSYIILGMTQRMGLALGLHVESNRFPPSERHQRRSVWWSMAWQDSHFSMSYDRPSTTAISQPDIAYGPSSTPGNRSYFETMSRVISLTLELVRGRMLSPHFHMNFKTIQAYKERIQNILADGAPHLRDENSCVTPMDNLQRLALKVHAAYIKSELFRPALKTTVDKEEPLSMKVQRDLISSLIETVESYIELHAFSTHGSRSWITLQRAISSAFLLAVIEESQYEPKVWQLLRQLEGIISESASAEADYGGRSSKRAANTSMTSPLGMGSRGGSRGSYDYSPITGMTNAPLSISDSFSGPGTASIPATVAADSRTQWAKPITQSLNALQKLNAAFGKLSATKSLTAVTATSPDPKKHIGGSSPIYSHSQPSSALPYGYSPYGQSSGSGGALSNLGSTSRPGSTPESSTSGEWTIPNLLDRAAEYIHPPLWG